MNQQPIDVLTEVSNPQAVAVREQGGAVGQALSISELHRNLEFVREVMRTEMKEGQDFGKIPGTGDRPTLLQPGAQKLLLTFNLCERVKHEVMRDFPNYHREYEFTLTVCARNGKEWDGIGTCSTLESKYRYRKAERKCPECGKHTIIAGKEEYGGGWVCFKKKGGCGAKFANNDQRITGQSVGKAEHDNPPDFWGTVRKMAFKRALVHAAINATNTSDLWTQDLEEGLPGGDSSSVEEPVRPQPAPMPLSRDTTKTPQKGISGAAKGNPVDSEQHLLKLKARMVEALTPERGLAESFFRTVDWLMPQETIEKLELRYVPRTKEEFDALVECIHGSEPVLPYKPRTEQVAEKPKVQTKEEQPNLDGQTAGDEWWRGVIIPVPHKGQKRDEYMKNPETIGMLYDMRHGNDEESQAARQRLWGFINNYEAKGWEKRDGTKMPPSEADKKFRQALDACADWHEKNHPEEKL